MRIHETVLAGVLIMDPEPVADDRGFFARIWDREALTSLGLSADCSQVSVAYNEVGGTLRGLHYQSPPFEEAKTIRCTSGAVFDVAVDLREDSPTRLRWVGVELSGANRRSLYVPEGFAHGYVTLVDGSEVAYMIATPYHAEAARGIRWDDPSIGIAWPVEIRRISARDAALPPVGGHVPG